MREESWLPFGGAADAAGPDRRQDEESSGRRDLGQSGDDRGRRHVTVVDIVHRDDEAHPRAHPRKPLGDTVDESSKICSRRRGSFDSLDEPELLEDGWIQQRFARLEWIGLE
jgi:hypothetical protein